MEDAPISEDTPEDIIPVTVLRCFWTAPGADMAMIDISLGGLHLALMAPEEGEAKAFMYYVQVMKQPNLFFALPMVLARKCGARFDDSVDPKRSVALAFVDDKDVLYFSHTDSANRSLSAAITLAYRMQWTMDEDGNVWRVTRENCAPENFNSLTVSQKPCPPLDKTRSSTWAQLNDCRACGRIDFRLRVCSRCKQVSYCTQKCQKADWKLHKKHCQ